MIKIKKIFFLLIFLFAIIINVSAEIKDGIFMTIGDRPITKSDLVDEIKIILILNNESYDNERRDILHELAVKSTIKRTIKNIELERNNYYKLSDKDFNIELTNLASN